MKIDAHCHTNCSDGVLTIEERMAMVVDLGFDAATITDHDYISTAQVELARSCAPQIPYIPGIEFSCINNDKIVHILGYFINPEDNGIQNYIAEMDYRELEITKKMLAALKKEQVVITLDELKSNPLHTCHYLRLLKVLALKVHNNKEKVFNYYMGALAVNNMRWLDFFTCSVQEAIELIHAAQGIAVLAHPGFEADPFMGNLGFLDHDEEVIKSYANWGLDGIESHCPSHSPRQYLYFDTIAESCNLLTTEGSDCHGEDSYLGPSLMDKFEVQFDNGYERLVARHRAVLSTRQGGES